MTLVSLVSATVECNAMSRFGDHDLFSSGPHLFFVAGMSLRRSLAQAPGSQGAELSPQGVEPRTITQHGHLLADTPEQLQAQIRAIEVMLDGLPRMLIDDVSRRWEQVVMTDIEPQEMRRVGTRWCVPYRIKYLQVTP